MWGYREAGTRPDETGHRIVFEEYWHFGSGGIILYSLSIKITSIVNYVTSVILKVGPGPEQ